MGQKRRSLLSKYVLELQQQKGPPRLSSPISFPWHQSWQFGHASRVGSELATVSRVTSSHRNTPSRLAVGSGFDGLGVIDLTGGHLLCYYPRDTLSYQLPPSFSIVINGIKAKVDVYVASLQSLCHGIASERVMTGALFTSEMKSVDGTDCRQPPRLSG
jgi:hypothetical protein